MSTKIQWAQEVWNPVTGCSKISAGCKNCYAERMSKRLAGRFGYPKDDPFRVTVHLDKLDEPAKWKKPRRVFVCSMGDLFHKDVTDAMIAEVLDVIEAYPQHTYQILTKRPERMADYAFTSPNVWVGTSIENASHSLRAKALGECVAKVRFLSLEPLLGPIDMEDLWFLPEWVIIGCESGPGRRPCDRQWARDIVRQCNGAEIPVFVKQLPNGNGGIEKMPELFGRQWKQYPEM